MNACLRNDNLLWARRTLLKKGFTWSKARKILTNHFDTPARLNALQGKLYKMKIKNGEKIQEFGDRFMNVVNELRMRDGPKLMTMFCYCLPQKYRHYIQVQRGLIPGALGTVASVIDFVQGFENYDDDRKIVEPNKPPFKQKFGQHKGQLFYCEFHGKGSNHPSNKCLVLERQWKAADKVSQDKSPEKTTEKTRSPAKPYEKLQKDLSTVTCFKCQKKGHYAGACTNKPPGVRAVQISGGGEDLSDLEEPPEEMPESIWDNYPTLRRIQVDNEKIDIRARMTKVEESRDKIVVPIDLGHKLVG